MTETMTPTPQERAEKIVARHGPLGDGLAAIVRRNLTEDIRVAIVEATNAEVEKRRKAEAFALTMEMILRCHAEQVLHIMAAPILCMCCGNLADGMDAAKEHANVCPEDPAVQRLAARERDIAEAVRHWEIIRRDTEMLREYVVDHGGDHDDNCPIDDTCECRFAERNAAVNRICNLTGIDAATESLHRGADDGK